MDVLEAQGRALRAQGAALSTTGADIDSTWQGLAAFYRAPEASDLFAATGPVRSTAAFVGSDLGSVGDALTAYAAEARAIQARLRSLQAQAQSFVDSVAGDSGWRKDGDKVNTNNRLLQEVDAAVADWMAAQRACANRIDALYGGIQYRQDDGKGKPSIDEYGYSAKELDAAANSKQGLPWGKPDQRDKPWYEDAWDDLCSFGKGLVIDGLWGTVKGLGNLVGLGGWENFKNSWVGLEKLGLALTPGMVSLNEVVALPGLKRGELANTLVVTGKALVSWDEWSKDPARAAGSTIFNVIAAVGTDGAGAAAEGVGDAGKVADLARAGEVADDASLASKAAGYVGKGLSGLDDLQHAITGLPRVQDVAAALGSKIPDIKIPVHADAGVVDHAGALDRAGGLDHASAVDREGATVGAGHGEQIGHDAPGNGLPHTGDGGPAASGHDVSGGSGAHDVPGAGGHQPSAGGAGHFGGGHDAPPPAGPAPADLPPAEHMHVAEANISAGAHTFASNADAAHYGEQEWNNYASHLPADEKQALFDYTTDPPHPVSYVDINNQLRGLSDPTPVVTEHVHEIDRALAGHPVPEDVIVTRGTGLSHLGVSPMEMIGERFEDKAYMSTSLGGPAAAFAGKEAILHLRVPAGTPALYLERVSAYGGGERELLLGRGVEYTVTDVVRDDNGQWQIYGEVLPK